LRNGKCESFTSIRVKLQLQLTLKSSFSQCPITVLLGSQVLRKLLLTNSDTSNVIFSTYFVKTIKYPTRISAIHVLSQHCIYNNSL